MKLTGYSRKNSKAGIRDYNVIFSTVALTNRWGEIVSNKVPEAILCCGELTRGLRGIDLVRQNEFTKSLILHPNIGSILILTLDIISQNSLINFIEEISKPAEVISLLSCKGMDDAISKASIKINELIQLKQVTRKSIHFSDITIGLECGGSDATSSLCANPTIGGFVDTLINKGGTAIVSETAEFVGAESIIKQKCKNKKIERQILSKLKIEEKRLTNDGIDYRGTNPTSENIEAGLTTLKEKTMGAIAKTGDSFFSGCLDFGEKPNGDGLYFMDTPFFSPTSITGMLSGGAVLILFGLGVYNPSGNPLCPTIKICGNPETNKIWKDLIDLDVSNILNGKMILNRGVELLNEEVIRVICGKTTKTELLKEGQFILPKTIEPL